MDYETGYHGVTVMDLHMVRARLQGADPKTSYRKRATKLARIDVLHRDPPPRSSLGTVSRFREQLEMSCENLSEVDEVTEPSSVSTVSEPDPIKVSKTEPTKTTANTSDGSVETIPTTSEESIAREESQTGTDPQTGSGSAEEDKSVSPTPPAEKEQSELISEPGPENKNLVPTINARDGSDDESESGGFQMDSRIPSDAFKLLGIEGDSEDTVTSDSDGGGSQQASFLQNAPQSLSSFRFSETDEPLVPVVPPSLVGSPWDPAAVSAIQPAPVVAPASPPMVMPTETEEPAPVRKTVSFGATSQKVFEVTEAPKADEDDSPDSSETGWGPSQPECDWGSDSGSDEPFGSTNEPKKAEKSEKTEVSAPPAPRKQDSVITNESPESLARAESDNALGIMPKPPATQNVRYSKFLICSTVYSYLQYE